MPEDNLTIFEKLFEYPELETWANILEVVGTSIGVIAFVFTWRISNKVRDIKRKVLLDGSINKHCKNLSTHRENLNNLLNNYNDNRRNITIEITSIQAEAEVLKNKVEKSITKDFKGLSRKIRVIRWKGLEDSTKIPKNKLLKLFYKFRYADNEDVWKVYEKLLIAQTKIIDFKNSKKMHL